MELIKGLDLQPRLINNELVNTINTRKLYNELGLGKAQYSRWIKTNLLENEFFIDNVDYIGVRQNVEGNEIITYYATFDTAKHLCMLSRTEKAHKIRRYFIQVEKDHFTKEKIRNRHLRQKYLTQERQLQVINRLNMTDKIKELYNNPPFYVYTNYTKLIYKKVFGTNELKSIKKRFNMTEKETIRDTNKISQDLKDLITKWEYDIHCILEVEKIKKTPKEECYNKVKEFLQI